MLGRRERVLSTSRPAYFWAYSVGIQGVVQKSEEFNIAGRLNSNLTGNVSLNECGFGSRFHSNRGLEPKLKVVHARAPCFG